jgi:hypothetical protein
MVNRRIFLAAGAGLVTAAIPKLASAVACVPPTLTLDNSETVINDCAPAGVPGYISSMNSFQVRALTGAFAPTNGFTTLRSRTPPEWLTGTPYNDYIMPPWSGGPKPTTGTKMYVHGGGHGNSLNNGMYAFDLAGSSLPTGWTLPRISSPSAADSGGGAYSDGRPRAVHTYDGLCELNGVIYRYGGATYVGNFLGEMWAFNIATSTWSARASAPQGGYGATIADPVSNKILVIHQYSASAGSTNQYMFYRPATNTWSAVKAVSSIWPNYACGAYRPSSSTYLIAGSGKAFSGVIDWSAETITQTSRSLGSLQGTAGPSTVYDPTADRFWMFGGVSQPNSINEVNPTTWGVTSRALSGDGLGSYESNYQGSFGRFVFINGYRAIGFANSPTNPAYVIKLP